MSEAPTSHCRELGCWSLEGFPPPLSFQCRHSHPVCCSVKCLGTDGPAGAEQVEVGGEAASGGGARALNAGTCFEFRLGWTASEEPRAGGKGALESCWSPGGPKPCFTLPYGQGWPSGPSVPNECGGRQDPVGPGEPGIALKPA